MAQPLLCRNSFVGRISTAAAVARTLLFGRINRNRAHDFFGRYKTTVARNSFFGRIDRNRAREFFSRLQSHCRARTLLFGRINRNRARDFFGHTNRNRAREYFSVVRTATALVNIFRSATKPLSPLSLSTYYSVGYKTTVAADVCQRSQGKGSRLRHG